MMVGCTESTGSGDLVDYDKEKIKGSLDRLSFEPEIPDLLPYEPAETMIELMSIGGGENNLLSVTFVSNSKEKITFRASLAENAFGFTDEKVKISDDLEGSYGEKDQMNVLKWDKDQVYYELMSESVTRDDMLQTAQNFYKIN